jgi:hydrophobic/amphiphilic exporter-1 (mainly G- bacteria), HAE1 family
MASSMLTALGFAVIFIFLVLASLYESFITPFAIMLALPLALCGAFFALFITGESLNLFALLGIIMLLGVASKNSILLVDLAHRLMDQGKDRKVALMEAGKTRLRPILMTSMALIAGTMPVALGLSEASKTRASMGIAIIGGLITSTILSLIVIPAAFLYIDRFRVFVGKGFRKISGAQELSELESGTKPG